MDRFRTSEVYNTHNQTNLSADVVRSNLESVIEYQKSQMSLMSVIKMLVVLLTAVIVIVLTIFLLRPSLRVTGCPIERDQYTLTERIRYSWFGIEPVCVGDVAAQGEPASQASRDSIWDKLMPSGLSKEDKERMDRLKNQKFSVKGYLPSIPDYEQIKRNKAQYDLSNELNQSCFEGGNQLDNPSFKSVKTYLTSIFGVQLDQNSNDNDFKGVKQQLDSQADRYGDATQLMDKEFIFNVQYSVNDLVNSHKNYLRKKSQLNSVQALFFEKMRLLEGMSADLATAKSNIDLEKEKNGNFQARLDDADGTITSLNNKINEKKDSLTKKQKDQIEHLEKLGNSIFELEEELKVKPTTLAEIKLKESQVLKNQVAIEHKNKTLDQLRKDLQELLNRKESNAVKQNEFDAKQRELEKKRRIHQMKLDILLESSQIKEFLEGLMNKERNINDLNAIVDTKISKESQLLEEVKDYNEAKEKFDQLEGETVVDEETDASAQIESLIKKDRDDLELIKSKYEDLKKVVDEYQDTKLEINNLKVKIQDLTTALDDLEKEKKNYFKGDYNIQDRIDSLTNKIKTIEDEVERLRQQIVDNTEFCRSKRSWFEDKERQLTDLKEERSRYKKQYDKENAEINKIFEDLTNQLNEARKNRQAIIDEKKTFEITIRRMEDEMKQKVDDCVTLKLYLQEMEKLMPVS